MARGKKKRRARDPLKELLSTRHSLLKKEQALLRGLNRLMKQMGYQVVPVEKAIAALGRPGRKPGRPPKRRPGRPPKQPTATQPRRRGRPPKVTEAAA